MNASDGGPAFPQLRRDPWGNYFTAPGMSLREWFAGMALQGLLANAEFGLLHADRLADMSYQQADAMLREREKGAKG